MGHFTHTSEKKTRVKKEIEKKLNFLLEDSREKILNYYQLQIEADKCENGFDEKAK